MRFDVAAGVQGVVPDNVKLLPGQLLGIRETVRDARPPPLPSRLPLPSFESPYARIDELDLEPDTENGTVVKQPDTAEADVDATNRSTAFIVDQFLLIFVFLHFFLSVIVCDICW